MYARNNPLRYVDPNGLDDITYDQAGNEIDRRKRGKWHNFFVGDSWKLKADSGQTYNLDASLKPLRNGQQYQLVSAADTKQSIIQFAEHQTIDAVYWSNSSALRDVITNSPSGKAWDFKIQAITRQQLLTSLFEYEGGRLYHADYVGNLAWGYIMAIYGYPEAFSKFGAGLFHTFEAWRCIHDYGSVSSWGDDPRDTEAIGKGYDLWKLRPKFPYPIQ